ncbi:MAG TPA: carboxypeptidase-like regulatory domain-containing protein, partial [Enhygromyxa sp.]|nr:carboxypeptidase-like regulatory domain-containing protein [Enhygromyxa sp.]
MRERGRVVFVVALVAAAILLWLMFGQGERAGSNDEERTPASVGVERDGGRLASRRPEHARTSPSEREADAVDEPAPELGAHRPLRARVHADSSHHGALVGRVINWSTREGVAAAELGFVQDGVTHTLATDASGSFRFVAPGPGTWQLATITADGYLPYAPELGRGSVRFVARAGQRIEHADLF